MDPIIEHKTLIEKMVKRTPSLGASLVRKEGIYSKAKSKQKLNSLVAKLDENDRELLAQMLEYEKQDGIFQALVQLSEDCTLEGLKLIKGVVEIPHEPFGYTFFEEFITLLDDNGDWSSMEEKS